MKREVVIIGGGPAGLAAAIEAKKDGCDVLLIDENRKAGGQLFKQLHKFFGSSAHRAGVRGIDIGKELLEESEKIQVDVWLNSPCIGIFPDKRAAVLRDGKTEIVEAEKLLLCTGGAENPLRFPGWTLPGVMGAGAAQTMTAQKLPLSDALYSAFIYGTFQLSNIAVFVQHAKSFEKPGDAIKSMGVGFVINALMMVMVVLGLMTVYTNPEAATQDVPTLFMVQNGVGASFMTPLISILIILGAVSTAVNMVAAMVKRLCKDDRQTSARQAEATSAGAAASAADATDAEAATPYPAAAKHRRWNISGKEVLAAFLCCIVDFGIAQFGLLTLIQKAYSSIAYLAIPVILIPYVIHMVVTRMDTKDKKQ